MIKKWRLLFFIIIFSLCFLQLSIAGRKTRNISKGKSLFRMNCRVCHNPGGKAHVLDPRKKKMKEWESIFAEDKYKKYPCKTEWEKLSTQNLKDILLFLRSEAPDSTVPRGCG